MAAPLAIASIGSSIIGGGISAFGKMQEAQSQSQMYTYQAGVADYNAKIAADNAEYAMNAGQQKAAEYGMKLGQEIGTSKVAFGSGNIAVNSGSAADTIASERKVGQIDTANILNDAARTAYGYQVQGQQATMQGALYRSAAADVQKAAPIEAIGSLVSGAGSVSDKWLKYGQSFGSGAGVSE